MRQGRAGGLPVRRPRRPPGDGDRRRPRPVRRPRATRWPGAGAGREAATRPTRTDGHDHDTRTTQEGGAPMTNTDWATKDFYKVLGVGQGRDARPTSRRPTASWRASNHPDSKPGDKAAEERFKAVAEAYDVVGDEEKRKQYDETRAMFAGGFGPFRAAGRPARRATAPRPSTSATSSRGSPAPAVASVTSSTTCSGAAVPAAAPPHLAAAGPGHRDLDDHRLHRRARGRHRLAPAGLATRPARRAAAPAPRPASMPRVCPELRRRRHARGLGRRWLSRSTRPAPSCRGRGMVVDDPCPACHGSGRGLSDRSDPGAHPGRGQGRPEDQAARQGRRRASTAARPATCSSSSR